MGGSVWGIILDVWMMSKTLFWVGVDEDEWG